MIALPDESATLALGAALAGPAKRGHVIALSGPLGAGKTTLARRFIQALAGKDEEVVSPTFTLVQIYEAPTPIWHFDLYRLDKPEDVLELGLEEALAAAITVIEWPERLGRLIPADRLDVTLSLQGTGRQAEIVYQGVGEVTVAEREAVIREFLARHGWGEAKRWRLAGDASFRKYDRLEDARGRVVLMDAPPPQEDVRPFVRIARHLYALGFAVPGVLAEDASNGLLLLEDLGDDTYTRLLAQGHSERALYTLAVDTLIALHKEPKATPEGVIAYGMPRLLEEVGRLYTWYLPMVGGATLNPRARDAYEALWRKVLPLAWKAPTSLILFDYHVDNLLLLPRDGIKACGLLDFQDAVSGPVTYDLMSLLEDARRDVDPAVVEDLKRHYLAAFPALRLEDFNASFAVMAAQRHMRVIGTFARLKVRDNKPHYLVHMPRLWRYMDRCLAHPSLFELRAWLDQNVPPSQRVVPA